MSHTQTDILLEYYLYNRLRLQLSDFLPRDLDAEREIQLFGLVEELLGWSFFNSICPQKAQGGLQSLVERIDNAAWENFRKTTENTSSMNDFFHNSYPLPSFLDKFHFSHRSAWSRLNWSVYWLRILAKADHEDVNAAFKTALAIFHRELEGFPNVAPIGKILDKDLPFAWDDSHSIVRFNSSENVGGLFLVQGVSGAQVVNVPIRICGIPRYHTSHNNPDCLPAPEYLLWGKVPALLERPSADNFATLISDSIMVSNRLQLSSECNKPNGLSCVSWYGGKEAIKQVQWEKIVAGQPYFLVLDHSGQTAKDACEMALCAYEKVKEKTGKETRFVSCLKISPDWSIDRWSIRRLPCIMDLQEFRRFAENIDTINSGKVPTRICNFQFQPPPRVKLFHPSIFTGTKVLIHGAENEEIKRFTMALAKRVDYKNFHSHSCLAGGWKACSPARVLYLCDPAIAQSAYESLTGMQNGVYIRTFDYGLDLSDAFGVDAVKKEVCDFMRSCCDSSLPGVVFLDGFRWFLSLAKDGQPTIGLREISDIVMASNGALVVVVPAPLNRKEVDRICKKVGFDTVVSVESEMPSEPHKVAMTVRIVKGFKLPKSEPTRRKLEYCQLDDRWKVVSVKLSIEEEVAKVCELKRKERTEKEIEAKTGIPQARVKERIGRARAEGRLPPARPYNR